MNALYLTLAYLHVFVCVCLILLVILQKTTGNGLFTTSQSNPFMSGAEITQFITKLTVFFVILFFINTLVLAKISYTSNSERRNIISASKIEEDEKAVPILD